MKIWFINLTSMIIFERIPYCISKQITMKVFDKGKQNTKLCSSVQRLTKNLQRTFACSFVCWHTQKKHPLEPQELRKSEVTTNTHFKASFFAFKSKLVPSTLWLEFNYKSCLAVFRLKLDLTRHFKPTFPLVVYCVGIGFDSTEKRD